MISGGLKNRKQNRNKRVTQIKSLCLILILALLVLTTGPNAFGKDLVISPDMQFDYALQCYQKKDYETAVVEFKRFAHFFPGDRRAGEAGFMGAMGLYQLKRFREAAGAFNEIILAEGDPVFKEESYFMQSKAFMGMGNLGYARIVLQNYLKLTEDGAARDRAHSMLADLGVRSSRGIDIKDLENARENLSKISPEGSTQYLAADRADTLDKALAAPRKNPTVAGLLAAVPGAGFLYCERYQDALVSFVLNAGLIMAAYEAFDQGNEALGGVIGLVETGFYAGNIYGSMAAAHRYNQNAVLNILNAQFSLTSGLDVENKAWSIGLKYDF
jgi:outer membrane protein assembly factor BamD (BamD/ComL family)